MKTSAAKQTIRICKPASLTAKQKKELVVLKKLSDENIDYNDIPPLGEAFWKNAVQGKFYRPTKTSTTMRLDDDVLYWLRSQGKGYQTRVNAILREAMLHEVHKA